MESEGSAAVAMASSSADRTFLVGSGQHTDGNMLVVNEALPIKPVLLETKTQRNDRDGNSDTAAAALGNMCLAVEMTKEAYARSVAALVHQFPHLAPSFVKNDHTKLKSLAEKQAVVPPSQTVTTLQQFFQRAHFNDWIAQSYVSRLDDTIGLVAPASKTTPTLFLRRSQPFYPNPSIADEKTTTTTVHHYHHHRRHPSSPAATPNGRTGGRDLQTLGYQRFPYSTHALPNPIRATSVFVSYEQMTYRHYVSITDGKKYMLTVRTELPLTDLPDDLFMQANLFFQTQYPTPQPPPYLSYSSAAQQQQQQAVDTVPLLNLVVSWNDDKNKSSAANATSEFPVPLYDIVRVNSPWHLPTTTQIVDLVSQLACEVDSLCPSVYFLTTLNSIYVTNPSELGSSSQAPIRFRLCPFACGLTTELPPTIDRDLLMKRSFATLLLQLALWITEPMRLDLHPLVLESYVACPGLLAAFHEVWTMTCKPGTNHQMSLFESSPSLATFRLLRKYPHDAIPSPYSADHIPGLITALACTRSSTFSKKAVHILYDMVLYSDEEVTLPMLSLCAGAIVPSTRITTSTTTSTSSSSSSTTTRIIKHRTTWIKRMLVISSMLASLEKRGDYEATRRVIDVCMAAGLYTQLNDTLNVIGSSSTETLSLYNQQFTFVTVVTSVMNMILASVHYPALRRRRIYHSNVIQMSRTLLEWKRSYCAKQPQGEATGGDGDDHELYEVCGIEFPKCMNVDTLISMMMVMSDAGMWCTQFDASSSILINRTTSSSSSDSANNSGLDFSTEEAIVSECIKCWNSISDKVFVDSVLPCSLTASSAPLSSSTVAVLVQRLESIARSLSKQVKIKKSNHTCAAVLQQRLALVLDWCTHFAWRAPEQVAVASYVSPYTSYYFASVYKRFGQTFFLGSTNRRLQQANSTRQQQAYGTFARQRTPSTDSVGDRIIVSQSDMMDERGYTSANDEQEDDGDNDDSESLLPHPLISKRALQQHQHSPCLSNSPVNDECFVFDDVCEANSAYPFLDCDDPWDMTRARTHTTPPDEIFDEIVASIHQFSYLNPTDAPVVRMNRKEPITVDMLLSMATEGPTSFAAPPGADRQFSMRLYSPKPQRNGAPEGHLDCFLSIPDSRSHHIKYHSWPVRQQHQQQQQLNSTQQQISPDEATFSNYHQVYSISFDELASDHTLTVVGMDNTLIRALFKPVTLVASSQHLCQVLQPEVGTTGMFHVKLTDSGETNDLVIGVTWDLGKEQQQQQQHSLESVIPGFSPTSIGLSSTGCIYFIGSDGGSNSMPRQVSMPYTAPFCSGSDVSIGIAYDRVYFVVDNVFYPPVPNLFLPNKSSIHAMVRLGCLGMRVSTQNLTCTWSEEKSGSNMLVHGPSNPLAYSLFVARKKTLVCPHYLPHLRPSSCRPTFSEQDERDIANALVQKDDDDAVSVEEHRMDGVRRVRICRLASETCPGDSSCRALLIIKSLMDETFNKVCNLSRRLSLSQTTLLSSNGNNTSLPNK